MSEGRNRGRKTLEQATAVVQASIMEDSARVGAVTKKRKEPTERHYRGRSHRECGSRREGEDKKLSEAGRFSCPLLISRTFPEHL
jgi:hypothetical protein